MDWVFEGIGTALVIFVLGFFVAKVRQRQQRIKQTQKAGDGARQVQSGRDSKVGDIE